MVGKLLVELKAKYTDLNKAREILKEINAKFIGRYHQVDTYYLIGEKRLKLRNVDDKEYFLVYYERPNLASIKQSKIILAKILDGIELNEILEGILGIKVIVDKIREIYEYKGVRIHLDSVKYLGNFIEFEKPTTKNKIVNDRKLLEDLMLTFRITRDDLIGKSYSDLLLDHLTKS